MKYAIGDRVPDPESERDPGNLPWGDLGAQTTQAMRNVGIALAAAGASYENIVKLTTYVVNYKPEHRAIVGKARGAHFTKGPPPASTLVGVSALAMSEWLVVIEAIAVIG